MQLTISVPDDLAEVALAALARATGATDESQEAVEVGLTSFVATVVAQHLTTQRVAEENRIARAETAAEVSAAFGLSLLEPRAESPGVARREAIRANRLAPDG